MTIRTLLVDDEPLAREKLRGFLETENDIEIVAECRNGQEALEHLESDPPDLVFLDVQMPELDGFEVLENLDPAKLPVVVFVTAFDRYALQAFEVHAADYLLKPYDRERFRAALDRARRELARDELDEVRAELRRLLDEVEQRKTGHPERLVIKNSGRVVLVAVADIDWIDAAGNYVKIHAGGEVYQQRETMSGLEDRLDPAQFLRIHRSTIVRLDRIKELQQQFHGDYVVVLQGGQRLTLSRSYRDRLHEALDHTL
ncbi:MAG: response regulator [Acidobacteriota bacterium]